MVKDRFQFGDHTVWLKTRPDVELSSIFMTVWIENKQFRKSLKTKDLDEARDKAKKMILKLLVKIESGQKIFSITVAELRKDYLKHIDQKMTMGKLAKGTVTNITRRVGRAVQFLETKGHTANAAIDTVYSDLWKDYPAWRLEKQTMRLDVIDAELTNIRAMFLWAKEKGLCGEKNIPVWDDMQDVEDSKRRRITAMEYATAMKIIHAWASSDSNSEDEGAYRRRIVSIVFRLIDISGMRTGEVLQLKNSDIQMTRTDVTIHIRAETSKVKKPRTITIHHAGAALFRRWMKSWLKHKKPDDYIFGCNGGDENGLDTFYSTFKKLRESELTQAGLGWVDPYHCRHMFITDCLLRGEPIHLIAKFCGTSTKMIEKTYDNIITGMIGRKFAERKTVYQKDGSWLVVNRPEDGSVATKVTITKTP